MEETRQGPGATPGRDDGKKAREEEVRASRLHRLIHRYHSLVTEHPGSPHTWACLLFFVFVGLCAVLLLPGVERRFSRLVLYHFTTLLALTPSSLAFGYFAMGRRRTFQCRKRAILDYVQFRERFARSMSDGKPFFIPLIEIKDEELQQLHPRAGRYFIAALVLALPFLIVGELSESLHGVQAPFTYLPVLPVSDAPSSEGLRGLVFAGYGVFVYTLISIIRRIQAAALSSEFLLSTAMRAVVMMTIGFTAGEVGFFTDVGTPAQALLVYFSLGAFPNWGYDALRTKAKGLLKPRHAGEEQLPLEMVDGLDAPLVDRLEELGISDVQHLATSDPVDLTLYTLFPLHRIVDWIDQAILITYLRDKVSVARQLGLRGAIDMRSAYLQAMQPALPLRRPDGPASPLGMETDAQLVLPVPSDPSTRARTVLQELAIRGGLGIQSVYVMGDSLANDFHVLLLANLWHHQGVGEPESARHHRLLVQAVSAALSQCGLRLVGGNDGQIPHGTSPLRPGALPHFQQQFPRHLRMELEKLALEWRGDPAEVCDEERYEEIYRRLLRHIGPGLRESSAVEPEPPRRRAWGRRRQRSRARTGA